MRTKIAVSTIGLLITLTGCGSAETTTGSTTTGGHGGGAMTSTSTGAGGASGTSGTGGDAATSTGTLNPGAGAFGAPCTKNGDCVSLLCVDTDATHAVCTKPCDAGAACPPGPEWSCAMKGGAPQTICLCQPSGDEICDGQDNNCDGVVDEGDCPELVLAASGPIADLDLAGGKLVFVTDKTIEKVDLAPGSVAAVLKSNVVGVEALGVNTTSIAWIQGAFHKMDFQGIAAPDTAVALTPPAQQLAMDDLFAYYSDASNTYVLVNGLNKLTSYGPAGDMRLAGGEYYWYNGSKILHVKASANNTPGTVITATSQPAPVFLADSAGTLYWGGANGEISKAASPLYTVTNVLMGEPGITGLTVDATSIYWATSDSLTSTLWKVPLAGGAKAKIGGVTGKAQHLVASGNHVYFETGKLIWRLPT